MKVGPAQAANTVVEIGPAMQDDDCRAVPNFPRIQLRVVDRDAAFMRRGITFCSQPQLLTPEATMLRIRKQRPQRLALVSWR
jgi:hypothetical protein